MFKIQQVYYATNSMKDELVEATRVASELVGRRDLLKEQHKQREDNNT
jgi:hypothetical protein